MAGQAKPIWQTVTLQGNHITSLDADGFTVGDQVRVNGNSICGAGSDPCVYYWTAFNADSNIAVGSYTGNGAATQAITGVGFAPDYVMIYGDDNNWARNRTRFTSGVLGAGANFRIRNSGQNATSIPSLDADGFTVGDGSAGQEDSNENTTIYHYVAIRNQPGAIRVGSYAGDGTSPRDVTGVGFQPVYVLVQSLDDGDQAFQKSDQMPAADSSDFLNGLLGARIVGLIADGFQVSGDSRVNSGGEDYTYVAFSGTGGATLTQGHARWRNDDGPEGSGAAPTQASATVDDTTASGTDVLAAGMSITPGAGDYIAWFSSSVENDLADTNQFVSMYRGGAQIAHTERHIHTEGSIQDNSFPVATHSYLAGVGASEAIDIRYRTDGGNATMHERTLVLAPVNPADVNQVSGTTDTTTTSAADVAVSGMSITPGAGDYIVWFSGSVEGDAGGSDQFVSIYLNGAQVQHTERQIHTESSIPDTSFPVAAHAYLAGVGAGHTIEVRWRTTGGTATMHERTLTVAAASAADAFQATAIADTGTGSATDVLMAPLTLTPGAGDYLAWFSSSVEGSGSDTTQNVSIYDNGTRVDHTEREIFQENSIPGTSFPIASHGVISGLGGGEAVDVRARTTGGTLTMHQRTLTLHRTGSAGATWAEAEDTKLVGLTKSTPRRIRFAISNGGAGSSGPIAYELQVAETATCGSGTLYSTVPTGSERALAGHRLGRSLRTARPRTTWSLPVSPTTPPRSSPASSKTPAIRPARITLANDYLYRDRVRGAGDDERDGRWRLLLPPVRCHQQPGARQRTRAMPRYSLIGIAAWNAVALANTTSRTRSTDRFTSATSHERRSVPVPADRRRWLRSRITELRVQFTTGARRRRYGDVSAGRALPRRERRRAISTAETLPLATGVSGSGGALTFTGLSEESWPRHELHTSLATVSNLVPR